MKQAGAELGKAQPKLGLGRIKIFLALAKSRKVVWDQTSPDHIKNVSLRKLMQQKFLSGPKTFWLSVSWIN